MAGRMAARLSRTRCPRRRGCSAIGATPRGGRGRLRVGAARLGRRGRVRAHRGRVQPWHEHAQALTARELPGRRCARHTPGWRSRTGGGPRRVAVRRRAAGRGAALAALGSRTRAGGCGRAVGASARGPRTARALPRTIWRGRAVRLAAGGIAGGQVRQTRPRRNALERWSRVRRSSRLADRAPVEPRMGGRASCRRMGCRHARPLACGGQRASERGGDATVAASTRRAGGLPLAGRARAQRARSRARGLGRARLGGTPRDRVRCAVGLASGRGWGASRA